MILPTFVSADTANQDSSNATAGFTGQWNESSAQPILTAQEKQDFPKNLPDTGDLKNSSNLTVLTFFISLIFVLIFKLKKERTHE